MYNPNPLDDLRAAYENVASASAEIGSRLNLLKDTKAKRKWQQWFFQATLLQEKISDAIEILRNPEAAKNELLRQTSTLTKKGGRLPAADKR